MLVLHYTGLRSGDLALARLCDPAAEVSCHYLVWEDGRIDQLVPEAARAWHAGRSCWRGETDINAVSIGIEIVNSGHDGGCPPYPEAQIEAVRALGRDICARRAIPPSRVLAHSDVAPTRKQDPGEHFPWSRLAGCGLGVWPQSPQLVELALSPLGPAPVGSAECTRLRGRLEEIGYAFPACQAGGGDDAGDVVRAFQRHWRPTRVDGVIDGETAGLIDAVADATG